MSYNNGNVNGFHVKSKKDMDILKEGVIEHRDSVKFNSSDEELVEMGNMWLSEAKTEHDSIKEIQDRNECYYLGNQLANHRLDDLDARIVLNKVYQTLHTLIPRATERLPAPMATLPSSDDDGEIIDHREYTQNVEEIVLAVAEEQNLSNKLRDFLLFQQLYMLGVLKYGYDEDGGLWVKNIRPQRIFVPPYDSEDYVIEYHEATIEDLIEEFPKAANKIRGELLGNRKKDGNVGLGSIVGYYEYTTPEFKFWKVNQIILHKEKNRNYNFKRKKANHWEKPQMDYIFSDFERLGSGIYSQTTVVNQIITLQDAVNRRKRQIYRNVDRSNGVIVAYGKGQITKQEAAAIEQARKRSDGVVYLENAEQGSLQNFPGQQLSGGVFEDMQHTISEIDNIAGTHSTLRGEKTPGEETFGGRQLLKESDQERIGELTEMIERVAETLYNAFLQLIKVHFKRADYVVYIGADGTDKQIQIKRDLVKEGLKVRVRQGTTLMKDKPTLSQEAISLFNMGVMDPVTLYERIGDPNPYKTAERFFLWQTDPGKLFANVTSEVEKSTQSSREDAVNQSAVQAGRENQSLAEGQPTPPSENVTPVHMAIHQDFIGSPDFANFPVEIKQATLDHMRAEKEILESGISEKKEKEKVKGSVETNLDDSGGIPLQLKRK